MNVAKLTESTDRLSPVADKLAGRYQPLTVVNETAASSLLQGSAVGSQKEVLIAVVQSSAHTSAALSAARAQIAELKGQRSVVAVEEVGFLEDGSLYVVIEKVSGINLKDLIAKKGPLPFDRLQKLFVPFMEELVTRQRASAFEDAIGVAQLIIAGEGSESERLLLADYDFPRRLCQANRADPAAGEAHIAAEVYQLGVCLYYAFSGKFPKSSATGYALEQGLLPLHAARREDIEYYELENIVAKCLDGGMQERYVDVASVLRDLARADGLIRVGERSPAVERNRKRLTMAGIGALSLAVCLIVLWLRAKEPSETFIGSGLQHRLAYLNVRQQVAAGRNAANALDKVDAMLAEDCQADLYYIRAKTLYDLGRYADALKDLDQAAGVATSTTEVQPSEIHQRKAECLSKLGRYDEAAREYELCVHDANVRGPLLLDCLFQEAVAWRKAHQYRRALDTLNAGDDLAKKLDLEFSGGKFSETGLSFIAIGKSGEAIAHLQTEKSQKKDPRALITLGCAFAENDQCALSKQTFLQSTIDNNGIEALRKFYAEEVFRHKKDYMSKAAVCLDKLNAERKLGL